MKQYEKPIMKTTKIETEDILYVSGKITPDIDGNSGSFLNEWLKNE